MATISIKQLLEAGVHFGHQTGRWNPKMKSFIFGERNGIHIIDLQQTRQFFNEAINFMTTLAAQGKTVLFVGTKSQAREAIEEEARRCGMYWITNRWLGGLLTNFSTVQNSIKRYRELETMRDNGFYEKLSKKEVARLERERKKLEKNLRGIRDIDRCPDVLFVVDSKQEAIAVQEAAKLNIPIIAIVDTNSDPDLIDYVIPGNDDALRAVKLFAGTMADAILTGRSVYTARVETEMQEAQEKAAKEEAQRQAAKEAKEAAKLSAEKAQAKQVEKPVAKARVVKKVQVSVPQEPIAPPREVPVAVDKQSESPVQEVVIKEPEESGVETAAEAGKVAVEETSASTAPEETPVAAVEEEPKQAPAKKKAPAKKAKSKAATTAKVKIAATKSKKTASKSKKTASTKSKATKRTAKTSDAAAVKKSSA